MKRVNNKYSTLLAACLVITSGGAYAQPDERNERTVRDGDFRQVEAGSKGPWQIPNDESSQADRGENDADNNMRRDESQSTSEYRSQQDEESRISDDRERTDSDRDLASNQSEQEAVVYFEFDSADLSEEAKQSLKSLAESVSESERNNLEVVIEGHTDSTGPSVYNEYLSEKRAKSVKEYLEQQDLAAKNWDIIPAGDSSPQADNDSRSGREENRRAEVRLQASGSSTRDDGLSSR